MKNPGGLKLTTRGDREIVMTREFHAPRALVFDALTKPELVRRWLLGPGGWSMPVCEIDPRVGGKYRYEWRNDTTGAEMAMGGVFREIVIPERIVATEKFDEAWYPGEALDTTVLTEKGETTLLTMTVRFESKEARDIALKSDMERGVAASYDRLEEILAPGRGNKIAPHLWFDKEAKEAAELYVSAFGNGSKIKSTRVLHDTPSGSVEIVNLDLLGQSFTFLSAGPLFKFTPAVSFLVACATKDEVDAIWGKLSKGGTVLMELAAYAFSRRYGWLQDKYGLSWQVMLARDREIQQRITPTLMFVGDVSGKAEEAIRFYASTFRGSSVGDLLRYGKGEEPEKAGTIKHAAFTLEGQGFAAMDSARKHPFTFNEAISFIVHCKTQDEIDYYWGKLSADPKAEQCGWLKDKYGLSWQVVPTVMNEMMKEGDAKRMARVTDAFLKMKKFDIEALERAYRGEESLAR